jgi:hypothetical protein
MDVGAKSLVYLVRWLYSPAGMHQSLFRVEQRLTTFGVRFNCTLDRTTPFVNTADAPERPIMRLWGWKLPHSFHSKKRLVPGTNRSDSNSDT